MIPAAMTVAQRIRNGAVRELLQRFNIVQQKYFSQELLSQMSRATKRGAKTILINSRDLHGSMGDFTAAHHVSNACEKAMRDEMVAGDTVIVEKDNNFGFTVRYGLPRVAY